MPQEMDRCTFEYAELKGKAYFSAFGKVTKEFLRAFRDNKHYEVILSAFLQRLFVDPENISSENYRHLETTLVDRVNAILAEERAHDKERLAKGRKPVYELQQDDEEEEEEEEPALTEEEIQRQEQERLERERLEEERIAAREAERLRNEEALRARARQVDKEAMEKVLQQAVLLNPGHLKPKMGGKQQQQQQQESASAERLLELESQVAHLFKEKERLQTVLHTSEDELPAKLAEAKEQLAAGVAKLNSKDIAGGSAAQKPPMQPKQLNARLAELKQKSSKLTMERNRLALQLKAQPHPLREEMLAVMQQRDETQLKLDQA